MQINIPFEVVEDLRKLLNQLNNQCDAIQDDTMGVFYHDTQLTHDKNSDPDALNEMDISTLLLAKKVREKLRFD